MIKDECVVKSSSGAYDIEACNIKSILSIQVELNEISWPFTQDCAVLIPNWVILDDMLS
jgi:hypothetical protein